MKPTQSKTLGTSQLSFVDHIAIAVESIEKAIPFYRDVLGLELLEERETQMNGSGMISVVFSAGAFTIVLAESTSPDSQVARYIAEYGPGVHHVAFAVENIENTVSELESNNLDFATDLIKSDGLKQIFVKRHKESGMMYELVERKGQYGFIDENVQKLFSQCEEEGIV